MAQKKIDKLEIQKEKLKSLFLAMIDTNIAIMNFQMTATNDKNDLKGLKKLVKESEKAKEIIKSINHCEILVSLYNTFVDKKELLFITLVKSIINKATIVKWDRTKKGFNDFLELDRQAKEQFDKENKEKQENLDFIKKAKEQGKKVEMLYKDGKLKPVIVEEA